VRETVAQLERRHPLIATRLDYRDGSPVMRPAAGDRSVAVILDLREASPTEFELQLIRAVEAPFDILAGPLWRIIAAQGPNDTNTLSFAGHHLAADAISTRILCKDFGDLYFDGELEPQTEAYATFTAE